MKKFKLTGLCVCLAALSLTACGEDGSKSICDIEECQALPNVDAVQCGYKGCIVNSCLAGFYNCNEDASDGCESTTACPDDKGPDDHGPGTQNPGTQNPGKTDPSNPPVQSGCYVTFTYQNVYTCQATGGDKDCGNSFHT